MKVVNKRIWVRSLLGAAAATALASAAWAQGQPVKIGLLATLEEARANGFEIDESLKPGTPLQPGVHVYDDWPLADLRDAALSLKAGGVGFYAESRFVHLDTGRVRRW